MAKQTRAAIAEADAILFLVDGRAGLTEQDRTIARLLRRSGRPVFLVVNKVGGPATRPRDGRVPRARAGRALRNLRRARRERRRGDRARAGVDPAVGARQDAPIDPDLPIKVAIIGRPNVGKSTLVNTLLGEERVIAFDEPGTTRDSIYLDFEKNGRRYTLIDTAGVRRRGKVFEAVEKFSVVKTLQAIEDANVVVLMFDADQGVTEQDAHLAGYILEAGRALVVAVNKWDRVPTARRDEVKRELDRKAGFLSFARQHFISAKAGTGVAGVLRSVDAAFAAAMAKLPTPKLTRALAVAVERQQPPRAGKGRPKLRYAHQGGQNPPLVVIHGTALSHIPASYRRYLEHFFVETFQLRGTPLRIQFKTAANPYVGTPARRRGH